MATGKIQKPPEEREELEALASDLLNKAGVYGVLPTPLEALYDHVGVTCISELPEKEAYMKTLGKAARAKFQSTMQKIRGIADLRDDVVYIPKGQTNARDRFARAHEISHQTIPSHNVTDPYIDTNFELSSAVTDQFEREANYMGAELIFQVDHFRRIALDHKASISAALLLADEHGASYHATIWKLIEVQDERICVAQYYPINSNHHKQGFRLDKTVGSDNFNKKINEIELPVKIDTNHDWFTAIQLGEMPSGTIQLNVDGMPRTFEWSAWFNKYTLFVMLRDKPTLHGIGRIIKPSKKVIIPSKEIIR